MMKLYYKEMKSSVGKLKLVASDDALVAVLWERERQGRVRLAEMSRTEGHAVLEQAEGELEEYFAGRRTRFEVKLAPIGTPFQLKVWEALRSIPFGSSRSYGELARAIGKPSASRAVGAANGRNPISIIVPCHRVIGQDGSLTGFAGGLEAKRILLALESSRRKRPIAGSGPGLAPNLQRQLADAC
jgi:methylated-DNA-[protein]-cysteine S-methyltransferase